MGYIEDERAEVFYEFEDLLYERGKTVGKVREWKRDELGNVGIFSYVYVCKHCSGLIVYENYGSTASGISEESFLHIPLGSEYWGKKVEDWLKDEWTYLD